MISKESATKLIQRLNDIDETEDLEAKEISGKDVGRSFYETVCALANEPGLGGGVILLGVKREVGLFPFYVATGVQDPDKISSDIVSACASIFNNPFHLNIDAERVGKKTVLKVSVPELPKSQKPLYLRAVGLPKGAYRRSGPTDVRCTDEDMTAFFSDQSHETADGQIVREASWNDLDQSAIRAYRKARKEAYSSASELEMSDEEMLISLNAVKRVEGKIRITLAGILLFGGPSSLRRLFPSHRFDYIRVSSHGWAEDVESPFEAIEMRGPLLLVANRIMAAITDDLPKAFRIEAQHSAQRTETPVIPHRVIREAVINSLMHRNYKVNKPVQILRYPNRIEIRNPGYSLKSEERFDESGSTLRNPHIAEVLHETRFAETKGSGIKVMKQMMAKAGLASPTFDSDRAIDEFTASFLFHHFLDQSDIDWLANFKDLDLTEDQMKGLIFVREVGAINNSVYRSLNGVDTLTSSKNLRKLRTMNLLTEMDKGARTSYVPGPEFIRLTNKDGSTSERVVTIDAKTFEGNHTDVNTLLSAMPEKLRKAVKTAQLSPRLNAEMANDLIFRMCKWRELSLAEIADLIGKKPAHVSNKYLQQLLADGRITYTIPEMIQHPHQKYTAGP